MPITKILVFTAVWKRPEITEICFRGIERLKTHPDYEINTLAVISEDEMIPLCEKYGINWVMYKNDPLGEKKNAGLKEAQNFDFEYLLEIGSDDLITNELLTHYKNHMDKKFFGVRDVAYINYDGGECRRLQSKSTYGAGRMIHRSLLELMKWKLWDDKLNRGLDNNSIFAFMRKGVNYQQVPSMERPGVIDIKSEVNIWKFNYFLGVEYDIKNILDLLSEDEVKMICCKVESK